MFEALMTMPNEGQESNLQRRNLIRFTYSYSLYRSIWTVFHPPFEFKLRRPFVSATSVRLDDRLS